MPGRQPEAGTLRAVTRQGTRQQDRQLRPSPKAPGRGSPTPCTWVDRPREQRRGHRPAHSQGVHTTTLSKVPAVTAPQRVSAMRPSTVTEHHGQQRARKATTRRKGFGSTPSSRPSTALLIIQAIRNFPRDDGPARKQVGQASRGTVGNIFCFAAGTHRGPNAARKSKGQGPRSRAAADDTSGSPKDRGTVGKMVDDAVQQRAAHHVNVNAHVVPSPMLPSAVKYLSIYLYIYIYIYRER